MIACSLVVKVFAFVGAWFSILFVGFGAMVVVQSAWDRKKAKQ